MLYCNYIWKKCIFYAGLEELKHYNFDDFYPIHPKISAFQTTKHQRFPKKND